MLQSIRRILSFGYSDVGSSPPPDHGPKTPRRRMSSPERAKCSEADGVCPSAEVGAAVSSTGVKARRRRQHQRRKLKLAATETDPKDADSDQERAAEDLDATKASVSDPKNDFDRKINEAGCSATLDGANSSDLHDHAPLHAPPSIAPSDHNNKADGVDPSPEVDATASSTGPAAARRQRHGEKRRERKRVATDTKNVGTGQEHSASDPIPLQSDHSTTTDRKNVSKGQEPAASHPKPPHLEHSTTGILLDDHAPLEAPPVDDHDGLHGAALSAAATSTTQEWNTVVRKKRRPPPALPRPGLAPAPAAPPRRTRPSTSVQGHRSPAVAIMGRQCSAVSLGLLDDLDGVESFFYKLFDEPVDECRARHERYLASCSSLKSNLTFCLACFLKDEKEAEIENRFSEVIKHMRSSHKGGRWFKCEKSGCYAMATTAQDIALHHLYAHHA
ncbi:hypothetical protein ACQ4PT_070827 [Festuca glaucescens]